MAEQRGKKVPVHARHDQIVEIHWRLADGTQRVERRTVPTMSAEPKHFPSPQSLTKTWPPKGEE